MKEWVNELNRAFPKKSKWPKHMKKCSTSLAIKEMQIKTKLRHDLTPVRNVVIKNKNNNKCWQGCGKKGTLMHYWWECELVKQWKTVCRLLKKLKIVLAYIQQYYYWEYTRRNVRQVTIKMLAHPCLSQH
jgi:hypothetical protein